MAPLVRLFALFAIALATAVVASPHISRNVYSHAHRAVPAPVHVELPKRKRSLNKRCLPRPSSNSTTSAYPAPATSAPLNVAPEPSNPPSSAPTFSTPTPSPPPPSDTPTPTPSPSDTPAPSPSPTTTSTPPPPTTSSTPPPAETSAASSSGTSGEPSYLIGTQYGQGTYYETGLGACGITNNDSQYIAAVSHLLFDSFPGSNNNPNDNPVCGKTVTAHYQGNSVTVAITDRCTACQLTDLDFSPAAFDALASASLGRINISWDWDD